MTLLFFHTYNNIRFISLLQSMEERFTVLRILIPRHSPMSECLLETNSSQPLMPATRIYYGWILMLTTTLILGLKYNGTRRLEQLTLGVHSSVSVLIWSFTHFATSPLGQAYWISMHMGQSANIAHTTEFLFFTLIVGSGSSCSEILSSDQV